MSRTKKPGGKHAVAAASAYAAAQRKKAKANRVRKAKLNQPA